MLTQMHNILGEITAVRALLPLKQITSYFTCICLGRKSPGGTGGRAGDAYTGVPG